MNRPAWRASLRLAARDAWQHKTRSLLVIALVGLPVFAMSAGDVLYRTWQLSPNETLDRVIGASDAWLTWSGGLHIQQTPGAPFDGGVGWSGTDSGGPPSTAQVAGLLPSGSSVIPFRRSPDPLTFYSAAGLDSASLIGLDYSNPVAHGIVDQVSGRAPASASEVAVTSQLATEAGLSVGDRLRVVGRPAPFTVVGIVREKNDLGDTTVYGLPSVVPMPGPARTAEMLGSVGWLARTPRPVTWHDVLSWDRLGYVTLSRRVYLNPPPASRQPMFTDDGGPPISGRTITTATLIVGMAVLEIVLLAGPAFAVGARRRTRDLALLAAVGGGRADLRRSVLADAAVLGLTAGAVATALGIATAAVARPLVAPHLTGEPGSFTVPPLDLLGLVLVSVATALLAAILPAVRAARLDVVAALAGRRGTVRSHWRWPAIGGVLVAIGVAITFAAGASSGVLLGVALIEVGIIAATPALIGLVARGARWLPVTGRMALRDAGRTRAAASPAVAAVMAAVIGATAAAIGAASADAKARTMYDAQLPGRDVLVRTGTRPADLDAVTAALHKALPDAPTTVIRSARGSCFPPDSDSSSPRSCTDIAVRYPASATDYISGSYNSALPNVVVAGPAQVRALFGRTEPEAAAALAAGRAVVREPAAIADGAATLLISPRASTPRSVTVPATQVTSRFAPAEVILPPGLLARLGVSAAPVAVLATTARIPTPAQRQSLALGLSRTGHPHATVYEFGYQESASWVPFAFVGGAAFIAVFAALLATALANVDGRPDLVTLAAIGASPRTRRALSMSRAAVIAGLGCVIGTVAGLAPASAWVRSNQAAVVVPWPAVALLVVGIPVVTALLAGVFTRAGLPSERSG
jgi:putative ABC transport system permease protein